MAKKLKLAAAIVLAAFSGVFTVGLIVWDIINHDLFEGGASIAGVWSMIDFFMLGVTIFAVLHLIDVIISD